MITSSNIHYSIRLGNAEKVATSSDFVSWNESLQFGRWLMCLDLALDGPPFRVGFSFRLTMRAGVHNSVMPKLHLR